jgi:hypothetical protein
MSDKSNIMVKIMVLSATFNNISVISWRWREHEYPEKTTDLSQVTKNLTTSCYIEYTSP